VRFHTTRFQASVVQTVRAVFVTAGVVAGLSGMAFAAGGTVSGKVDATPAKYLEETVVYLKEVPGKHAPGTENMDQKGMKFIPHILTVTLGDSVDFLNHDSVAHNVYSPDNETYNLGSFKPEEKRSYTFKTAGMYTQLCSIHPEMLGFIFVGQNPYSAVVDKEGSFTIKDVPAGSYTIAVWNSHLKAADKKVTVAEGQSAEVSFSLHR
jgi:plastocyanin